MSYNIYDKYFITCKKTFSQIIKWNLVSDTNIIESNTIDSIIELI